MSGSYAMDLEDVCREIVIPDLRLALTQLQRGETREPREIVTRQLGRLEDYTPPKGEANALRESLLTTRRLIAQAIQQGDAGIDLEGFLTTVRRAGIELKKVDVALTTVLEAKRGGGPNGAP